MLKDGLYTELMGTPTQPPSGLVNRLTTIRAEHDGADLEIVRSGFGNAGTGQYDDIMVSAAAATTIIFFKHPRLPGRPMC